MFAKPASAFSLLAMPIQERENAQVLGASGGLLGSNDVVEIGNENLDGGNLDAMRLPLELRVSGGDSGWCESDVELTMVADEIPGLHRSEGRSVVIKRQPVWRARRAHSSAELLQRCR